MKIAFFDTKDYDIPAFKKYGQENKIEFRFFETRLTAETASLARGCYGVCVFVNDTLNAEVIDILKELGVKIIALRCAGYNNVDVKYAYDKIHIVRVPAYSPYAVAEHAAALLLTSVRRVHKAYNRTREFNFSLSGLTGFDLHGKTMGVVGTGKIGRIFIDICKGFGMNIIAYDKFPAENSGINYVSLPELFRESDIISFHCPLTEETFHLINSESVKTLKRGVILINTSRGAIIDSAALIEGIKGRRIGAACLDVYEEESDIFFNDFSGHIVDDDTLARLISLPNVIVTSHQAFLTSEALENIAETTVNNLLEFKKDGFSQNELCYRCGNVETCIRNRKEKCF
ncbi:MAG: 2-hydroxyacid dehydrogenase [Oscillospiraceae bacterium]|nr:2-hydroxyacid dehydrogenase [Oscillospiraceae bacterium]